MELHLLGLSHKTTPVEIREKVAITPLRLKEALGVFLSLEEVSGVVILSTCNRTEIYTQSASFGPSIKFLEDYFSLWFSEIEKYLYRFTGIKVIEHVMRVASGLDSMIVGEGQVLGQVKEAWKVALELKTTNSLLNTIFNRAVSCGKRARTETQISQGAVTVGSAAVELTRKIFGNLDPREVLIIGAGKMSESAAKNLKSNIIFVANRTFSRAQELAEKVKGIAVRFDALDEYLKTCDIVISSTGASHCLISKPRIQNILSYRKGNPLFLIDIAVPRDIDPRVGELSSVYLYDIDDLNAVAAENLKERQNEIPKVEGIIEEEKEDFLRWYQTKSTKKKLLSAPVEAAWL